MLLGVNEVNAASLLLTCWCVRLCLEHPGQGRGNGLAGTTAVTLRPPTQQNQILEKCIYTFLQHVNTSSSSSSSSSSTLSAACQVFMTFEGEPCYYLNQPFFNAALT